MEYFSEINRNELNIDTIWIEPKKYYAEWRKPDTNEYILYDIYMNSRGEQSAPQWKKTAVHYKKNEVVTWGRRKNGIVSKEPLGWWKDSIDDAYEKG